MANRRMHADEVETDAALVRALLTAQHPQWAGLPIERVPSAGTDNAMYRLGDDLAVRLPRTPSKVDFVTKEQEWLPFLAPQLPLPIPLPVATGRPGCGFPFPWTVARWLPGALATDDRIDDPIRAARDLAAFVRTLRSIDPTGGPWHERGDPVRRSDEMVRVGIAGLQGELDGASVATAWRRVLAAPDHDGPPAWFHGDLSPLNMLAEDGRLTAVIDWGTCGVGDPAIDASVVWSAFPPAGRDAYREALDIDDAAWERGKGWVLRGVYGIPYYRGTNPVLIGQVIRAIEAVLADP